MSSRSPSPFRHLECAELTATVTHLLNLYAPSFLLPKPPLPPPPTSSNLLYLAYGSNLDSGTFQGRRGIKPLSATVVTVPTLKLVFNLPGIAYFEPRVANVQPIHTESTSLLTPPLVGVVYEVTPTDYATIIATEGGGASYQDVIVDCFPVSGAEPLKAHTLLAPQSKTRAGDAQASKRYLGLITSGAVQHDLPVEYRRFLEGLEPYRITSVGQRIGGVLFAGIWLPLVLGAFLVARLAPGSGGRAPGWVVAMNDRIWKSMWWSYDHGFKKVFGDGERTVEEVEEEVEVEWEKGRVQRVEEMFMDEPMEGSTVSLSGSWEKI